MSGPKPVYVLKADFDDEMNDVRKLVNELAGKSTAMQAQLDKAIHDLHQAQEALQKSQLAVKDVLDSAAFKAAVVKEIHEQFKLGGQLTDGDSAPAEQFREWTAKKATQAAADFIAALQLVSQNGTNQEFVNFQAECKTISEDGTMSQEAKNAKLVTVSHDFHKVMMAVSENNNNIMYPRHYDSWGNFVTENALPISILISSARDMLPVDEDKLDAMIKSNFSIHLMEVGKMIEQNKCCKNKDAAASSSANDGESEKITTIGGVKCTTNKMKNQVQHALEIYEEFFAEKYMVRSSRRPTESFAIFHRTFGPQLPFNGISNIFFWFHTARSTPTDSNRDLIAAFERFIKPMFDEAVKSFFGFPNGAMILDEILKSLGNAVFEEPKTINNVLVVTPLCNQAVNVLLNNENSPVWHTRRNEFFQLLHWIYPALISFALLHTVSLKVLSKSLAVPSEFYKEFIVEKVVAVWHNIQLNVAMSFKDIYTAIPEIHIEAPCHKYLVLAGPATVDYGSSFYQVLSNFAAEKFKDTNTPSVTFVWYVYGSNKWSQRTTSFNRPNKTGGSAMKSSGGSGMKKYNDNNNNDNDGNARMGNEGKALFLQQRRERGLDQHNLQQKPANTGAGRTIGGVNNLIPFTELNANFAPHAKYAHRRNEPNLFYQTLEGFVFYFAGDQRFPAKIVDGAHNVGCLRCWHNHYYANKFPGKETEGKKKLETVAGYSASDANTASATKAVYPPFNHASTDCPYFMHHAPFKART